MLALIGVNTGDGVDSRCPPPSEMTLPRQAPSARNGEDIGAAGSSGLNPRSGTGPSTGIAKLWNDGCIAEDIVEVIGAVVELRPVGSRWIGRCPFHDGRTPSFSVNRKAGLFYCFGCGVRGNTLTFREMHGEGGDRP